MSRRTPVFSHALLVFVVGAGTGAGCNQKMAVDGRIPTYSTESRQRPPGTIATTERTAEPKPAFQDLALLRRGRQRYEISCAPCHGLSGYGNGMVVQRGLTPPPSYHSDRLRAAPDEHFFDVVTNGYGAMFSYGDRVEARDRWAIIAYIRALQLSQNASFDTLSAAEKEQVR